jgi:formate hydrogenlyase subunit 6/NADH:ubiquinone oxidoreductase subunit I
MAYFSNSTEGEIFDDQCSKCKYGQESCPIFAAQTLYNYDAVNNKVATEILNTIVNEKGICMMRETFKKDLATDWSIQQELF